MSPFINHTIPHRWGNPMDLLPKDKATWGIVLAIAAIVLAFPLSLLANLLTPDIRNWWAGRSIAAMRRRLSDLESERAKMETYTLISEGEETILMILRRMARAGANSPSIF